MKGWYVSHCAGSGRKIMSIAGTRDEAITRACRMLERGLDVEEVGPLIEARDGNVLGVDEIRELQLRQA